MTQSAKPPTEPPEPDWVAAWRADWEERIALSEEAVEHGVCPPEAVEVVRAQMEQELERAEERDDAQSDYWRHHAPAAGERVHVPLGAGLTPAAQAAMQRAHMDWLDDHIRDERTSPEWRFRLLRVRGVLSQRAGDLVGALLARARQVRPRPREQRSRRSRPSSRDGPSDEPPDDPDLDDRARRRSS